MGSCGRQRDRQRWRVLYIALCSPPRRRRRFAGRESSSPCRRFLVIGPPLPRRRFAGHGDVIASQVIGHRRWGVVIDV